MGTAVSATTTTKTLSQETWKARREAHQQRVRSWTEPHKARALRGEKHPVYDFLFSYYSFRPVWLLRWHPGPALALEGVDAREFLQWREYRKTAEGVAVDARTLPRHRREFAIWVRGLLASMQTRPPFFGCFGMHEWAMVYQQTPEQVRHNSYRLRFAPQEIAHIVESGGPCCTHYDAFRFFTDAARPLNRHQPDRTTTAELEQRGCLHANMDLYKWAYKLSPFTPSELVADCFALARDIREVDMRASPYDLREIGFTPICVEEPEGRLEYEAYQRIFSARSAPLRAKLIAVCDWLLA